VLFCLRLNQAVKFHKTGSNPKNIRNFVKNVLLQKNILGKIYLKNIRTFSYHGCLVEESKIGSNYRIDLVVKTDFSKSAKSDNLDDTVDYVALNQIVKEQMAIRSKLIENVAQRIANEILFKNPAVRWTKIKITKINPPIDGDVEAVSVAIKQKRNCNKHKK